MRYKVAVFEVGNDLEIYSQVVEVNPVKVIQKALMAMRDRRKKKVEETDEQGGMPF
jgi:hypothetical protein